MKTMRPVLMLFLVLSIITGLIYPLLVTGIGKLFFPHQVQGSLVMENGRLIGSELIGQSFTNSRYFWGRPSATKSYPYNATASGGTNLGPLNPALIAAVTARITVLRAQHSSFSSIPIDLVTASGSGLDPDISLASAFYQIDRISMVRNLPRKEIKALILSHAKTRVFKFFSEPRVNVLTLNLALDELSHE
jgi:potassium-transporting ATPase KdpC subunit